MTWPEVYTPDPDLEAPHLFFFSSRGEPYLGLFGLFDCDIHLFGIGHPAPASTSLFSWAPMNWEGLFSASSTEPRISLSIGLIGVFLSLALGLISAASPPSLAEAVDFVIQRIIESSSPFPRSRSGWP